MRGLQLRLAMAALSAAFAAPCAAQVSIGAGMEYFTWSEQTSPTVDESGPLYTFWLQYVQPKPRGWLLGYQGKLYFGDVDYNGALLSPPYTPVTSTTSYTGMSNELQVRYRGVSRSGFPLAFFMAAGLDAWRRQLSVVQMEDYRIGYVRIGVESGTPENLGWTAAAGGKYPFYTSEDAHLAEIGFDRNPTLTPGKSLSLYAQISYRFNPNVSLVGYTDGYRFAESNRVNVTDLGPPATPVVVYQPASDLQVYGIRAEYTFR